MHGSINESSLANYLLKALNNTEIATQIAEMPDSQTIVDFLFPNDRSAAAKLAHCGIDAPFFNLKKSQLENEQAALNFLYGQAGDEKVYTNSAFTQVNAILKDEYQKAIQNMQDVNRQQDLKQKYMDLEHEILTDPIQTACYLLKHQAKHYLSNWVNATNGVNGYPLKQDNLEQLKNYLQANY